MSFLLSQDACVANLRQFPAVTRRYLQNLGGLHVSAVTVTGLEMWLLNPRTPARYLQGYQTMLGEWVVLNVDDTIAHRAARIGINLPGTTRSPPLVALLLAATALEHGLTLVTHSSQPFATIPGLTVVDWMVP